MAIEGPHENQASAGANWHCLLCGNGRAAVVTRGPDFEYACSPGPFVLVQCVRCGHVSLDPIPPTEKVLEFYPASYYTVNPESPLYLHGFIYETKIRRDVERIQKYLDLSRLHSIVDIGGGDAARLFQLRKFVARDTECIAFDFRFPHALVESARAAGITLLEGNIETDLDLLKDESHNLIIMSQIVEHLRDPVLALETLRSKLAPEGYLLLDTPHRGGLDYRLFRRRYWGGYHIPRHLHLFTKDSLAETAIRLGYRVAQQGCLPSPGFWILSFRNALGLHSSHRTRSVFEFLNFSNLPAVGAFTALDLVCMTLRMSTSNQFVLLARN